MKFLAPIAAGLVLACTTPTSPERPGGAERQTVSDGRYLMGTVFEVTLENVERESAAEVFEALFDTAHTLEEQLSVYVEGSDLSSLNRAAGGQPLRVAPAVSGILGDSIGFWKLTGGAFDVTIGPLIALWMNAAETGRAPTPAELSAANARVGSDLIELDGDTARLTRVGMQVNLGGVAKGYALDRMLPVLRDRGIDAALLNFGQSSTWALGAPDGSVGWRLLVRRPDGGFAGILTLRDRALSVSGSLGQFVEIEGQRYGHIIDPRTGRPLIRQRQSVVVAPNAALAEALTKAMLILEADEALALVAAQSECHGLLIEAGGNMQATAGWDDAVAFERLAPDEIP